MLTKLPIENPIIIFKGTENDFYSKNHLLEINNIFIEIRYSQFYKNRIQNLSPELSFIKKNDTTIKEKNDIISNVIGYFNNPIFYLKRSINNVEYLVLVTFSESQPGLFWIGIESVWRVDKDKK